MPEGTLNDYRKGNAGEKLAVEPSRVGDAPRSARGLAESKTMQDHDIV